MLPSWKTVLGLSGLRSQTWQWLQWAHTLGRVGKKKAHVSGIYRLRELGEKTANSGGGITQWKIKPHRIQRALRAWHCLLCPTPLLCLSNTGTLLPLITSWWSHSCFCWLSTIQHATLCFLFFLGSTVNWTQGFICGHPKTHTPLLTSIPSLTYYTFEHLSGYIVNSSERWMWVCVTCDKTPHFFISFAYSLNNSSSQLS